jgi:hypothetical protein
MHASDEMQAQFKRKVAHYNCVVNQLVWLDKINFLGWKRKISHNWNGPMVFLNYNYKIANIEQMLLESNVILNQLNFRSILLNCCLCLILV